MSDDSEVRNVAEGAHAPKQVQVLAKKLADRQGCQVLVTREASGYHIYLPCPSCLETHGKNELRDPKFAINASKYLALGDNFSDLRDIQSERGTFNPMSAGRNVDAQETRNTKSGICMRTRQAKEPHRFSVTELLSMSSITERHPDIKTSSKIVGGAGSADRAAHWEIDPVSGILCPPPPGEVVPINELPSDHPGVEYLLDRGFNLDKLWEQFRCSFCTKEYPYGKNEIYYRKMPGGWMDTPQNRIIFYSLINGAPMTWQARYPERLSDDGLQKYALHPYSRTGQWDHVATRSNAGAAWMPVPPFDEVDERGTLRFQPSKYRTAKYSSRELIGWDAAVRRAQLDPEMIKWVILGEGPLDAARPGPGGVGLIGSSISPENAAKIASTFHIVFTAFDVDKAGREATERVMRALLSPSIRNPMVQQVVPIPIPEGKDPGALDQQKWDVLFRKIFLKATRSL